MVSDNLFRAFTTADNWLVSAENSLYILIYKYFIISIRTISHHRIIKIRLYLYIYNRLSKLVFINICMPPSFIVILGFILYIGLSALTLGIFSPMLFISSTKVLAMKIIATVLISFPCLIIILTLFTIVLAIPGMLLLWLLHQDYISKSFGMYLSISCILIYITMVIVCSLYLWYLLSRVFYQYIDKKPITQLLRKNKISDFVLLFLIKNKLILGINKSHVRYSKQS